MCVALLPAATHADVRITEVAWMGDQDSASNEWIELYNDGASVSLSGWELRDGIGLVIPLSGSLSGSSYAVLERTDDDSAPGTAFLLYTGALSNSGSTLSLHRGDDALESSVVGGDAWENIGGDNLTKETAQYADSGWVTAEATPGSGDIVGVPEDVVEEIHEEEKKNGEKVLASPSSVSTLHIEPRTAVATISAPAQVYVNQGAVFSAQTEGLADGIMQSMEYTWNFGDMGTAVGTEAQHRFRYPGEYAVSLYGQYKDYQTHARTQITVLPVSFTVTTTDKGDVQVTNDSTHEIDISGYRVTAVEVVRFPKGTVLLPGASIIIPKETVGYRSGAPVVLSDQLLGTVAEIPQRTFVQHAPVTAAPSAWTRPATVAIKSEDVTTLATPTTTADVVYQNQAAVATADVPKQSRLPYMGLLGVLSLGAVSVFAGRKRKKDL